MYRFVLELFFSLVIPLFAFESEVKMNTYMVPTEEKLKIYATFEILDAELRILKNGTTRIDYHLPQFLLGAEKFKIRGEGVHDGNLDKLVLKGPFANFDCKAEGMEAFCRVDYRELPVMGDGPEAKLARAKVKNYLSTVITDPNELEGRAAVVEIFGHEAGGEFHRLRVRDEREFF